MQLYYYFRLLQSTLWQWPYFKLPAPVDLTSKTIVVTGGNAGIGLETVRHLAQQGARVIIGCRSVEKGRQAVRLLEKETGLSKLQIYVAALDLADLQSVAAFAQQVNKLISGGTIDILVNNAGIMEVPYAQSPQGHELTFATNFLGHFLLTKLLLPALRNPGGRVVVVSAELHTLANDATPDYHYTDKGFQAYCRSKLASVWFAYELQRRQPNLVVPVLHPGVVATKMPAVPNFIKRLLFISPEKGAWTTLHCCLAPDIRGLTYYHNSLGIIPSSVVSYDEEKAAKLIEMSDRLTKDFVE